MFLATLATVLTGVLGWSPAQADTRAQATGRVVIIGVPGLMWSDISQQNTPALWGLTAGGSAAGLSVRTTRVNTCPTDGWLTVSAGQRSRLPHGDCALPSAPILPGQDSPPARCRRTARSP